jgi:hypothetical protein
LHGDTQGDSDHAAIAQEAHVLRDELRTDAIIGVLLNGVEVVDRKQTWYLLQQGLAVPDWMDVMEAAGGAQQAAPAGGNTLALALMLPPLL